MTGLRKTTGFTNIAKLLFCGIVLAMLPSTSTAQQATGVSIWGQAVTTIGKPAAYATIRVCPYASGGGIPCSPLTPLFSDPQLTQPVANPYTTDQYGNYTVFVAGGYQIVQINAGANTTYSYVVSTGGGASTPSYAAVGEQPSGPINGTNTSFTLSNTPVNGSLLVEYNGVVLSPNVGYTVVGPVVTLTTAPITTDRVYVNYFSASPTGSHSPVGEQPGGAINGVNLTFTLSKTPTSGVIVLQRNGLVLIPGTGYTLSGTSITFLSPPLTGDALYVNYLQ